MVVTRIAAPSLLAAFLLVFSGCTGSGSDSGDGQNNTTSVVGIDAGTAQIIGALLDDEDNPIVGAQVQLSGLAQLLAVSDETGGFIFQGLAAGDYVIQVAALSYLPASQALTLGDGEERSIEIRLEALPYSGPFPKLQQQQGYLQCTVRVSPGVPLYAPGALAPGWYTGVNTCGVVCIAECVPIWPEDKFLLVFNVNWTGMQEVTLEMQWQSTQALGKSLSVTLEHPDHVNDGTPTYGNDVGPSPLIVHSNESRVDEVWTVDELTEVCSQADEKEGCPFITRVFGSANTTNLEMPVEPPEVPEFGAPPKRIDAGWVMDQRFEQYFTSFHNMVKPEGYTALPS